MADLMNYDLLKDVLPPIISMISIITLSLIPSIVLADTFEMRQYLGHIEQSAALYSNAEIKIFVLQEVTNIRFNSDEIILTLRDGSQITHELVKENIIKDAYIEEETSRLVIIT